MNEFQDHWNHVERYKAAIAAGEAIALIWTIEDVKSVAEDGEIELTEDEAVEVLQRCYRAHDTGYGFTWGLISHFLYEFVEERGHAEQVFPPEYDND